jgi:multidrug efflux system membrane fusion protein
MRYALALSLLFLACSRAKTAAAPPPVPVRAAVATFEEVPLFIDAIGHVESIIQVEIRSRVEGELMEVYFQEGQEVRRGDLLFTIDPRPYQIAVKQAEATLEENLARLALAAEKVKRYAKLTLDEYYSQIDYETLQTQFASLTALVEQNRASLDNAKLNLEYCWIYAPSDGLTGILQIDQGNLVSADGPSALVTVNQMAPIYVTFSVPEKRLPEIRAAGTSLTTLVAFDSFDQPIKGFMQMIDNQVDKKTGMVKIRSIFDNLDRSLWPNQFMRTRLITQIVPAILVPYTSIQMTQTGPILYVIAPDQTVKVRPVKLGQREDDRVIITNGLEKGERVVTEGQLNLYEGAKVKVL